MTALFETEGLTKRYRGADVLADVSLAVGAGRRVALVGHNGAGKTTLIKLLLGLTRPSAGQARLLGQDPRGSGGRMVRQRVGYLPEAVALQGGLSGRALLRFYAGLKGAPADQIAGLLGEFGLAEAADRPVRTYSKGMRQRLGLAQALLGDPQLLFFDEPTNGLDPPLRRQLFDRVKALAAGGATAVVASHALSEIEDQAEMIVILRQGRLVAQGTLAELQQRSALPVRLRLRVAPETAGRVAETIGHDFTLRRAEDGDLEFVCGPRDKMAIVRRLAKLNGEVRDLDICPPRLEEIYQHFVGDGRPR